MVRRKITPGPVEAEVLVRSRRRCCVCFGLRRDDSVKKGQVAHLDGNPGNDNAQNLAFMCFDHHDEHDSRTSQSKGFTVDELKKYREELYAHFGDWRIKVTREHMLNFLAATISLDQMADAAIQAANTVFYADTLAYDVLVSTKKDYCDDDLLIPYLIALDRYVSWGWLRYTQEERRSSYGEERVYLTVEHEPFCRKVADVIRQRAKDRGDDLRTFDRHDALANLFTDDCD